MNVFVWTVNKLFVFATQMNFNNKFIMGFYSGKLNPLVIKQTNKTKTHIPTSIVLQPLGIILLLRHRKSVTTLFFIFFTVICLLINQKSEKQIKLHYSFSSCALKMLASFVCIFIVYFPNRSAQSHVYHTYCTYHFLISSIWAFCSYFHKSSTQHIIVPVYWWWNTRIKWIKA